MTNTYKGELGGVTRDGVPVPVSAPAETGVANAGARPREIVATENGREESEQHITLDEGGNGQNADGTMVVKKWQFTVFPYRGKGYRIQETDAVHAIPLARLRARRAFRVGAQSETTSRQTLVSSEMKNVGAESAERAGEAPSIADMLREGVRAEKERQHEAARGALFASLIAQYLVQYPDADARAEALAKARGYGFTFYDDKVKAMLEDPEVAASYGVLYGAYNESADALAGEDAEARRALREADRILFNKELAKALESGTAPKAEDIHGMPRALSPVNAAETGATQGDTPPVTEAALVVDETAETDAAVELAARCEAGFQTLSTTITAEVKRLFLLNSPALERRLKMLRAASEKGGIEFNNVLDILLVTYHDHPVRLAFDAHVANDTAWRQKDPHAAFKANTRYKYELDYAVVRGFVEGSLDGKNEKEHDAALSEARNEYFRERKAVFFQVYNPDVVRSVGKIAELRAAPPNGTYDAADTEAEELIRAEIERNPHSKVANAYVRYQKTVDLWVAAHLAQLPEGERGAARSQLLNEEASRYKQAMRGARS